MKKDPLNAFTGWLLVFIIITVLSGFQGLADSFSPGGAMMDIFVPWYKPLSIVAFLGMLSALIFLFIRQKIFRTITVISYILCTFLPLLAAFTHPSLFDMGVLMSMWIPSTAKMLVWSIYLFKSERVKAVLENAYVE